LIISNPILYNSEISVRLGANISETIKRKLSLGARILQVGGVEKIFMQYFSVKEDESLLKVSHCYLSTTSGPLSGLLFISNEKVAFCSDRSIKVFNQKGQMCRIRYKVSRELYKYIKKSLHISHFSLIQDFLCIGCNSTEEDQVCEAKSKC